MLGHTDRDEQKSTTDCDGEERFCKICYGADDAGGGEWMTPCKCSGSIKWVHKKCILRWLRSAPGGQKSRCLMCRYEYVKRWHLKPLASWQWPRFQLGAWDVVEILLDVYSTAKLARNIAASIQGTKSIVGQMFYFVFWKTFIFTDRRIQFYSGLCLDCVNSVFEPSIENAE